MMNIQNEYGFLYKGFLYFLFFEFSRYALNMYLFVLIAQKNKYIFILIFETTTKKKLSLISANICYMIFIFWKKSSSRYNVDVVVSDFAVGFFISYNERVSNLLLFIND